MDFNGMKRKKLQALCKKHKIPANLSNLQMVNRLSQLFKDGGKTILHGNVKNNDESGTKIQSSDAIVQRAVKKVRFSPENELFEFTRPAEPKRRSRRTSVLNRYGTTGLSVENVGHNGAALIGGYDESQVSQSKVRGRRPTVEDINERRSRSMRGKIQSKRNVLVDYAEEISREDSINDENLVAEMENFPGRLTRYRSKKLEEAYVVRENRKRRVVDNKVNVTSVGGGNDEKAAVNRRSLRNRHVVGEAEHSRNFEEISENNGEGQVKILKEKNVKVSVVGEPHVAPRRIAGKHNSRGTFNDDVKKLENRGNRGLRKTQNQVVLNFSEVPAQIKRSIRNTYKCKVNYVAQELDVNPVTQPENKKRKRKMRNVSREIATQSKIDLSSGKPSKQLQTMSEKTALLHDDTLDARETSPLENSQVSVSKPTQSAAKNDITKYHGKGEAASDVSENADENHNVASDKNSAFNVKDLFDDVTSAGIISQKAGFSADECSFVDLVSHTIIDRDTHLGSGKIDGLLLEDQNAEDDGGRDLRISDLRFDELQTQTLLERGEFTGDISTNSFEEKERSKEPFGSAPIVEELKIGNEADKIVQDARTDDQTKAETEISDDVEKGHLADDQIRTDVERGFSIANLFSIEEITEITHDVRISLLEVSLKNSDVPHSFSAESNFRTVRLSSQEKVNLKTSNPLKSQEAVVGGIIQVKEVEIQAEARGDEISKEKPFSVKENGTLDGADVSNRKDTACGTTIKSEAVFAGIIQGKEVKILRDESGDEIIEGTSVSSEERETLNQAGVCTQNDTDEPGSGEVVEASVSYEDADHVKTSNDKTELIPDSLEATTISEAYAAAETEDKNFSEASFEEAKETGTKCDRNGVTVTDSDEESTDMGPSQNCSDKSPNSTGKISDEMRTISESAASDFYSLGGFQSTCKDTTEEETSMEAMDKAMPTSGPTNVAASSTPTSLAVHLLSDENENHRIEESKSKLNAVTFAGNHHKTGEEAIFSPGFSVPELHFVETVVDSKDNPASALKMPASECDEVLKATDVADTIKEYIDCEPLFQLTWMTHQEILISQLRHQTTLMKQPLITNLTWMFCRKRI